MSGRDRARGFTLIELLIALAIFAVLSALSYRSLTSLFATREVLNEEARVLRERALFFARLDNDFAALVNRAVMNPDGQIEPALRMTAFPPRVTDAPLSFTRTGYIAADDTGSAPQRVGYRLREGNIELLIWNALDNAVRATPQSYIALRDIREAKWRALDANGNWQTEWPQQSGLIQGGSNRPDPFPRALELTLTTAGGERYTRLYAMRRMDEQLQ